MNDDGSVLNKIADLVLEGSIIGSFTKIGAAARQRLFDFDEIETDLSGQVAIVTGATSGIGKATAEGLLRLGAEVHITSRSLERATEAAHELDALGFAGSAVPHALDTADFESIAAFVADVRARPSGVDMLAHNAGALTSQYQANDQGTEMTLASHLIGPYLLTKALRSRFTAGARVIFMSSGGMYTQPLEVKRIELRETSYRGAIAYARAKRGQVELVTQIAPEWAPEVLLHSMHPGWVDTPGVDAGIPGFGKVMGPLLRSAEQGADTMVWLAATGGNGAEPGQFWLDRQPRGTSYAPGSEASPAERERLVEWLEEQIAPGIAGIPRA